MAAYNITANFASSSTAPLYPQAILFPLFAFPSWLLCVPSLVWHFSQGNIAAGSVVTWVVLNNFYNAINPLIWPRDNLTEWWDGNLWCDIGIRIQVGTNVGIAASTVMIIRKLARVMDTRNIIVSSSRNSKVKEKIWEVVWCWGFPMLMILLFYIVQPIRYFIFGIMGCISAYDTSWPSIVLIIMWAPITMLVAAYYAVLLIYRLYIYRREFHRLISARNTTKSRFIRLFILCIITVIAYLPYTLYLLVHMCAITLKDPYDWDRVHGPSFNNILRIPVYGKVSMEKWIQVATGYVIFFVYGTGMDAHNLYKRMLLSVGLGKWFPSLYTMDSGSATPSSFIAARSWSSSMSSKAKSVFWSKTSSETETMDGTTFNGSIRHNSIAPLEIIPAQDTLTKHTKPSFFKRLLRRRQRCSNILPLYSREEAPKSLVSVLPVPASTHKSSQGVEAHVWAAGDSAPSYLRTTPGVHIIREIHQDCCDKDDTEKAGK